MHPQLVTNYDSVFEQQLTVTRTSLSIHLSHYLIMLFTIDSRAIYGSTYSYHNPFP